MNKERLQTLANFLRTVPDAHFNLSSWRYTEGLDGDLGPETATDAELTSHACGTTGCAVGWACAMPKFQAQGLTWVVDSPQCTTNGTSVHQWYAVQNFFDIPYFTAQNLFSNEYYREEDDDHITTPAEVADRIEKTIRIS